MKKQKKRKIIDEMISISHNNDYTGDICPKCGNIVSTMVAFEDEPEKDYYSCYCGYVWEDK